MENLLSSVGIPHRGKTADVKKTQKTQEVLRKSCLSETTLEGF